MKAVFSYTLIFYFLLILSFFILAFAIFGEKGFVHVWQLRKENQRIRAHIQALVKENRQLEQQVISLREDPQMMEQLAREKLGFVGPDEKVYRFPSSDD